MGPFAFVPLLTLFLSVSGGEVLELVFELNPLRAAVGGLEQVCAQYSCSSSYAHGHGHGHGGVRFEVVPEYDESRRYKRLTGHFILVHMNIDQHHDHDHDVEQPTPSLATVTIAGNSTDTRSGTDTDTDTDTYLLGAGLDSKPTSATTTSTITSTTTEEFNTNPPTFEYQQFTNEGEMGTSRSAGDKKYSIFDQLNSR